MSQQIQVLIVEDNPTDAELLVRELRRASFDPQWRRVETEKDYLDSLHKGLDLILSDFEMPEFSGLRALELLKEGGYEIPFIIVSGTIGEEMAVAAIKLGATDYLLKDRTTRLGTAVDRALKEANERIEHKQVEGQLLWKTAFFEAQVNSALDGILIVDGAGKNVLQNQRLIDLWGLPRKFADDAVDQRQLDWMTGQMKSPAQFAEKVAYIAAHEDEISHDELELTDGRFFDRYSAPVRDKAGKHFGRIWAFRDVTERKRADEKIVEQAAFLDKAQDAILARNLEGRVLFWNTGAERLYGWTTQEAVGRNVEELLHSDPKEFEEINGLTISRGEWNGELQQLTKDRRQVTIEARWTLIRDGYGNPKSVLAINTDITEKKKLEAQFLRAQRMESIGTLAGGIAHDLNNILTPIMMSIDLLKTLSDSVKARKILETIEVSAKRGADIVGQVLSFARGLDGQRICVEPARLLEELEKIIKDTFPKDIRLQFSIPKNTWTILGDPTQVQQVFLNLSVNARDAMPLGGDLTFRVENCVLDEHWGVMHGPFKPGRYVRINVTDSGMGIPPKLINKIFEPFFTTKELKRGTGLGLSTVAAIVKSHEGIISVDSDPGKGTSFNVYFPALESTPEAMVEAPDLANMPRGRGETVLVVDDEESILTVTGQTLEAYGYRVLTATDGADAVAVFAEHRHEVALVLADMMMPVMDGAATVRALKRINPAIKIIGTSGLNYAEKVSSLDHGVHDFLIKPYTAGTLLEAIQRALGDSGAGER